MSFEDKNALKWVYRITRKGVDILAFGVFFSVGIPRFRIFAAYFQFSFIRMASIELKKEILDNCIAYVDDVIEAVQTAMRDAQDAAEEGASSGADEMDASRAMAEIEKEKGASQLAEAMKLKDALARVRIDRSYETVQVGALVYTSNGNFFVSAPTGKMKVDGKEYFAISPFSPIAKEMNGLKAGDSFQINGRSFEIKSVL
jgi:transcription elongation GreA/GreB family factor